MNNQYQKMRTLSEMMAEKVQEYINEQDCWEGEVFLWIEGNELEVNIGLFNEEYPGEKYLIDEFIASGDDHTITPDYDKIEEYVSGWFDLRQI